MAQATPIKMEFSQEATRVMRNLTRALEDQTKELREQNRQGQYKLMREEQADAADVRENP